MKLNLLILCLALSIPGFSQVEPVKLSVQVLKQTDRESKLQLDFSLAKGWHVYADDDTSLALDGLSVTCTNDEVVLVALEGANQPLRATINDPVFGGKRLKVYNQSFVLSKKLIVQQPGHGVVFLSVKGFASNNKEFVPIDITKQLVFDEQLTAMESLRVPTLSSPPLSGCGDKDIASSKGLLAVFLLGFGGGLLALLTPCVFPMLPVTVSYFTGKAKSKKVAMQQGIWYGASILLIYLAASIPFHIAGTVDPQIFNSIATNAWINLFFFGVFILFALSLFGLFEITLPPSFSNLAGSKSRLGSAAGIFFMALTLAIVSFSCTGPILGSLLVGSVSADKDAWALSAGMAGFGLALGLPFALFAVFPHWLQRVPKSGAWMNVVKKSLAFIELALAIKFLSNADLVEHWGLLKREVFVGLWMAIFLSLSLYLFGVFKRSEPSRPLPVLHLVKDKPSVFLQGRFWFGVLSLLFALYLVPGLTQSSYANLKLLSGFAPPLSYSIYGKDNIQGKGLKPDVVNDYDKALALAKQTGKPLLVDFTGWACVNCRKMEEQVWTNPRVKELIEEKFILLSLYVDDRSKLPAGEQRIYQQSSGKEKAIVTVGDKWATFQAENFGQVTQPLYVILSPDQKLVNQPVGYTPDAGRYQQWLECGLAGPDDKTAQQIN